MSVAIASLAIAVIAAGVAIWQGVSSHRQLDLARRTEKDTKEALTEIRDLSRENRATTTEIKSAIDERITKILDLRLEAERQVLESQRQEEEAKRASTAKGGEMAERFFGWVGKGLDDQMKKTVAEQAASKRREDEDEDSGAARSVE